MVKPFFLVATAGVALVIIFDMVTGQGPPQMQNLLAGSPIQFSVPPRVIMEPVPYPPRGQFDFQGKPPGINEEAKLEPISSQEYEKNLEEKRITENAGYENKQYSKPLTTPEPAKGMFSSLSNAWRSLTSLGRRTKRGTIDLGGNSNVNGDPGAEWSQSNNQGYIYFKIPKNSVCYN